MSTTAFYIMCIFFIFIIIYVIIMFESYRLGVGLFRPYIPIVPTNACQPLIDVIKLTPEEVAKRAQLLKNAPRRGSG